MSSSLNLPLDNGRDRQESAVRDQLRRGQIGLARKGPCAHCLRPACIPFDALNADGELYHYTCKPGTPNRPAPAAKRMSRFTPLDVADGSALTAPDAPHDQIVRRISHFIDPTHKADASRVPVRSDEALHPLASPVHLYNSRMHRIPRPMPVFRSTWDGSDNFRVNDQWMAFPWRSGSELAIVSSRGTHTIGVGYTASSASSVGSSAASHSSVSSPSASSAASNLSVGGGGAMSPPAGSAAHSRQSSFSPPAGGGGGGDAAAAPSAHTLSVALSPSAPVIKAHRQPILDFCFDPFNPDRLATCSADGWVKIWDIPTNGLSQHLRNPTSKFWVSDSFSSTSSADVSVVSALAFHPCRRDQLLMVVREPLVSMGIFSTVGQQVQVLPTAHKEPIVSAQFHPSGDWIATSSQGSRLGLMDLRLGGRVAPPLTTRGHESSAPSRVAWVGSRESGAASTTLLASAGSNDDNVVQLALWDVRKFTRPLAVAPLLASQGEPCTPLLFWDDANQMIVAGCQERSSLFFYRAEPEFRFLHAQELDPGHAALALLCPDPDLRRIPGNETDASLCRRRDTAPDATQAVTYSRLYRLRADNEVDALAIESAPLAEVLARKPGPPPPYAPVEIGEGDAVREMALLASWRTKLRSGPGASDAVDPTALAIRDSIRSELSSSAELIRASSIYVPEMPKIDAPQVPELLASGARGAGGVVGGGSGDAAVDSAAAASAHVAAVDRSASAEPQQVAHAPQPVVALRGATATATESSQELSRRVSVALESARLKRSDTSPYIHVGMSNGSLPSATALKHSKQQQRAAAAAAAAAADGDDSSGASSPSGNQPQQQQSLDSGSSYAASSPRLYKGASSPGPPTLGSQKSTASTSSDSTAISFATGTTALGRRLVLQRDPSTGLGRANETPDASPTQQAQQRKRVDPYAGESLASEVQPVISFRPPTPNPDAGTPGEALTFPTDSVDDYLEQPPHQHQHRSHTGRKDGDGKRRSGPSQRDKRSGGGASDMDAGNSLPIPGPPPGPPPSLHKSRTEPVGGQPARPSSPLRKKRSKKPHNGPAADSHSVVSSAASAATGVSVLSSPRMGAHPIHRQHSNVPGAPGGGGVGGGGGGGGAAGGPQLTSVMSLGPTLLRDGAKGLLALGAGVLNPDIALASMPPQSSRLKRPNRKHLKERSQTGPGLPPAAGGALADELSDDGSGVAGGGGGAPAAKRSQQQQQTPKKAHDPALDVIRARRAELEAKIKKLKEMQAAPLPEDAKGGASCSAAVADELVREAAEQALSLEKAREAAADHLAALREYQELYSRHLELRDNAKSSQKRLEDRVARLEAENLTLRQGGVVQGAAGGAGRAGVPGVGANAKALAAAAARDAEEVAAVARARREEALADLAKRSTRRVGESPDERRHVENIDAMFIGCGRRGVLEHDHYMPSPEELDPSLALDFDSSLRQHRLPATHTFEQLHNLIYLRTFYESVL